MSFMKRKLQSGEGAQPELVSVIEAASPDLEAVAGYSLPTDWLIQRVREALELDNLKDEAVYFDRHSHFGKFVTDRKLSKAEIAVLLVALAASHLPELLYPLRQSVVKGGKGIYIGGFLSKESTLFFPSLRTVLFLLAGKDVCRRSQLAAELHPKSSIFSLGIVKAVARDKSAPFLDHQLIFNDQFFGTLLSGAPPRLDGDPGFPVRRSGAMHTLGDVIVKSETLEGIFKLRRFARNMEQLWSLPGSEKIRRNFISIFTGEPGTGKSYAAEAVGNEIGIPVYKVNFAQLVSKYIGETEKNMEAVFDRFDKQLGILFFDEAEAIFSRRTEVKDSHDQHANNLQSYLLQKVEEFEGIVILATNVKDLTQYFDKAFQRRIRAIVTFEFPDYPERLQIWERSLFAPFTFEEGLVDKLAKNYQLSGGSIYNVVSDAIVEAMDEGSDLLTFEMFQSAMKDEFKKSGRKFEICTDEMVDAYPVRRYGPGFEKRKNF
jgi:hypothetical protein